MKNRLKKWMKEGAKLKKKYKLEKAVPVLESFIKNKTRYRVRSIPAAGALLKEEDLEEQQLEMTFE